MPVAPIATNDGGTTLPITQARLSSANDKIDLELIGGESPTREFAVAASAARTASIVTAAFANNGGALGLYVVIPTTAGGGAAGVYPVVQLPIDAAQSAYVTLHSAFTGAEMITATGSGASSPWYYFGPDSAAITGAKGARTIHLPKTFRLGVVHNDATSITYSVYAYVVR